MFESVKDKMVEYAAVVKQSYSEGYQKGKEKEAKMWDNHASRLRDVADLCEVRAEVCRQQAGVFAPAVEKPLADTVCRKLIVS